MTKTIQIKQKTSRGNHPVKEITKTFNYGKNQVVLETGGIARQATSAVVIRMGNTVLLVTTVAKKETETGQNFFPLTVNYQEKSYAVGKIPNTYFKREGRPTEKETVTSRLIDRPLRPLFPKGFYNEIQIVATVLSMDPKVPSDIPAIIGASASIALSGIPFNGPISAARVGYRDGEFLLNPSLTEIKDSRLNLIISGTKDAILMVESEAEELPEQIMLSSVLYGHQQMQSAIQAIDELVEEVGVKKWHWKAPEENIALEKQIAQHENKLVQAYQIPNKPERQDALKVLRNDVINEVLYASEMKDVNKAEVCKLFHNLERKVVRRQILSGQARIDGRDATAVRPISVKVGILPSVHGSSLFTRGETQALVVTTLGTERDAQWIDDLDGDRRESFIMHYNFPPYCVGEVGSVNNPKRREIGHGKLAKRAIKAVLPSLEEFPYVIRLVSEITESNGSSSMASVCGSSLALMDAGVPTTAPVAGIAMGLIKEGNQYAILTDILGDEDHLGDMDFKVAGTVKGITALQMDIKIRGITKDIIEKALLQAQAGRLHILNIMNEAINQPREEISSHAFKIITFKINPSKIRDVIGKGGSIIRELTETTHSTIDISDEGVVKIAAANASDRESARKRIEELTAEAQVGMIYEGPIVKLMDFGAFVSLFPGCQGLVHISQIMEEHVSNIRDHLQEGQVVRVKVIDIDRQGRVRLSMKEATLSA